MGWLITFGVTALLALIPLGAGIRYDVNGLLAQLIIGPVRIKLYPRLKKEKIKKSAQSKPAKQESKKTSASGGSITDFIPLINTALSFLNEFRQKIRIDRLRMKLILGGGDPADLALNYGKGWAVLGNLMPLLEQVFVIKKRDLEVECDFNADATTIHAAADIKITLYRLIALVVCYGIRALKQYLSIMNKRKGGANT